MLHPIVRRIRYFWELLQTEYTLHQIKVKSVPDSKRSSLLLLLGNCRFVVAFFDDVVSARFRIINRKAHSCMRCSKEMFSVVGRLNCPFGPGVSPGLSGLDRGVT